MHAHAPLHVQPKSTTATTGEKEIPKILRHDPEKIGDYYILPANLANTACKTNDTPELMHRRIVNKYNMASHYTLEKISGEGINTIYKLKGQANLTDIDIPTITNDNTPYHYVIIIDTDKKPKLRIGRKHHYHLTDRLRHYVAAAGDIEFKDGKISAITDRSGCYSIAGIDDLTAI